MIYCEYKLNHSFNIIYEEKEYAPKFGFLLSAMEDPFSHTALSGMSINFENDRLRIDNGTFAYGGYIVQTFHPLYMCSPDFSGIGKGHISVPPPPGDDIALVPGTETPGGIEPEPEPDDGTTPIIGEYDFEFKLKPGVSVRIAPSIDNHEFGIVKSFNLKYTTIVGATDTFTIDLTKTIPESIKFNKCKATIKWEDSNHIVINGFKDYINKNTTSIDNIQELSIDTTINNTMDTIDAYESNAINITVPNDAIIKIAMTQDGTLTLMDDTSNKYQLTLKYSPNENNDNIIFFKELLVIDKQGLYPIHMYIHNTIGVNKIIQKQPTLNPTQTLDASDYPDYITGFMWSEVDFQDNIIVKVTEETILDHISDKYYWLEIWSEEAISVTAINDINIEDVSCMGSYVDEHVNGYSITYDAAKHWLYINNINSFTIRFPSYDPVVTTPIPKELINSLHDGIIYTDYDKFEFTTETNPNNNNDIIKGETQSFSISLSTIANGTTYSFDFYPAWDTDTSIVYHIEFTPSDNTSIVDIYIGLISEFQSKVLPSEAIPTVIDGKMKIESARIGSDTINIDNMSNITTTTLSNGSDEDDTVGDSNVDEITSLWNGSTDELQALISDINDKLESEDQNSNSSTVDAANINAITDALIDMMENSQVDGVKNKVLVTFQYYHDLNLIKFQIKDSYDLTRNDCILATLITEDKSSYYITYRDYEFPRMIPYAEWNEFDAYSYASKYLPSLGNNSIPIDNTLIIQSTLNNTPGNGTTLHGSPTVIEITIPDDSVIGKYSFKINIVNKNTSYDISYNVSQQEDTMSIINGLYSSIVSSVNALEITVNKTDVSLLLASPVNGENTINISDIENVSAEVLSTGINNPESYNAITAGTPKTYTFTFNPASPNALYSFDVIKNSFNVTVSYLTPNTTSQEELFDALIIDFNSKVPEEVASIEKFDLGDGTFSLKIIAAELGVESLYVENVNAVSTIPIPGDHTTYRVDIDYVADTNSYTFDYKFKDVLNNPPINSIGNIYYETNYGATLSEIKAAIITEINDNYSSSINAMDPDVDSSSIVISSTVQGPNSIELLNFKTEQLDNSIKATPEIISITPEIVQENASYGMVIKDHNTSDEIQVSYVGLIDDTAESIIEAIAEKIKIADTNLSYTVTVPPVNGIPAELNILSNDQIITEEYTGYIMSPVLLDSGLLLYSNSSETIDTDYVDFYDIDLLESNMHKQAPIASLSGRYGYSIDITDKYYAISDPLDDAGKVYIYDVNTNSLINTIDGATFSSMGRFGRKIMIVDDIIVIAENLDTGNHKVFFIDIITSAVMNEISKSADNQFGGMGMAHNTRNIFLTGTACVYMYNLSGGAEIKVDAHDITIENYSKKIQANDKYIILSGEADAVHIFDVTGMDIIEYNSTIDKSSIENSLGISISARFGEHISLIDELLIITNDTQVLAYNIKDSTPFDTEITFTNITGLAANSSGFVITETKDGSELDYGVHYMTYDYVPAIPSGDGKTLIIESNNTGNMTFGVYNASELLVNIDDAGSDLPQTGIITPSLLKIGSFDDLENIPINDPNIDQGSLEDIWVNINDIVITNNGSPSGSGQCSTNVVSVNMVIRWKYNSKFVGNYSGVLEPGDDLQYWAAVVTDNLDDGEYIFEVTVTTELGNTATAVDESVIIDVDGEPNIIPDPKPVTCDVSDYDVVSSTLTQYSQAVALGKMLVYDFDKMLTICDMSSSNTDEITTTCAQGKSFLSMPLNLEATFHFNVPSDCTRMMIIPVLFGLSSDYDYEMTVNDRSVLTEHEFDHSMVYNNTTLDVNLICRCSKMLLSGMVLLYDSKSMNSTNNLRINHQLTRSGPMVDYIVIKGWEGLTTANLIESDFVKLTTSWNMVDPNGDDITVSVYFDNKYLLLESYEKNVNNLGLNISKAAILEKASIFSKADEDYLQVPITFRISNVNGTREINKYVLIRDLAQTNIKPIFQDNKKIITWENNESGLKEYLFVPVVQYLENIQYSIWFYKLETDSTPILTMDNNMPATIIRHTYSINDLPAVCKFEVYDVDGNLSDTITETII